MNQGTASLESFITEKFCQLRTSHEGPRSKPRTCSCPDLRCGAKGKTFTRRRAACCDLKNTRRRQGQSGARCRAANLRRKPGTGSARKNSGIAVQFVLALRWPSPEK